MIILYYVINEKVCILLILLTCIDHEAQDRKRKVYFTCTIF